MQYNNKFIRSHKSKGKFTIAISTKKFPLENIYPPKINLERIKPSLSRSFIIIFFVSSLLSIIGAIIRDKFDNVFHSDEEIKEDLKLPILGIFPYVKLLLNAREEKSIIFDFLSENETEDNPTISKYEKFFFRIFEKYFYFNTFFECR